MKARLAGAAVFAAAIAGITAGSAPAQAVCPVNPISVGSPGGTVYLLADCGLHTGIGSGHLGVDSAQDICVAGRCDYNGGLPSIGRTGAYYDWNTGKVCRNVNSTGWNCV